MVRYKANDLTSRCRTQRFSVLSVMNEPEVKKKCLVDLFTACRSTLTKDRQITLLDIAKFECMPGTLELVVSRKKLVKKYIRK